MNKGELYFLARKLKQLAEQAIGARPGQVEAVPVRNQLVLGAVLESPGSPVGEIARRLSIAQSAVSAAVVSLRDEGLVVTSIDSTDGRVTRVSPSEKLARWAGAHLSSGVDDVLDPLLTGMSSEDKTCVIRALDLLHSALLRHEETSEQGAGRRKREPVRRPR